MPENIGDRFQQETKYLRGKLGGGVLDWFNQPEPYKTYPNAPQIQLPAPGQTAGKGLWDILLRRRSHRSFKKEALSLEAVSQLLWSCQGISKGRRTHAFRTAPSAGALYPIETYLLVLNVHSLEAGIYHYHVLQHALELIKPGNWGLQAARAALDQDMVRQAPLTFIWTAIFARSKWKYQQRAYRYVYLDAGHIAGNLALAAVALGLGSCQIAALYDEEVNQLIEVDGQEESTLYMSVVGKI